MWPMWLRLAGAKVGKNCELGTFYDALPELIDIDQETFFADGVYLASPRVHRGTVAVQPAHLGKNTYFGNNVVVPVESRFDLRNLFITI
jgi:hypothetical protein